MQVSIEWFIVDNLLMNWMVLCLASACSGLPIRKCSGLLICMLGTMYAVASITWGGNTLSSPVGKVLFAGAMALAMVHHSMDFCRAIVCVLLSACMMGGVMFCFCFLVGGTVYQSVLIGTVQIRILLIGMLICSCLPHFVRTVLQQKQIQTLYLPLKIAMPNDTIEIQAFVDSGNLLKEPISNRPIILVKKGILGDIDHNKLPIGYQSVGGNGLLYVFEADCVYLYDERWHAVDALIAEADINVQCAEAIIPIGILPN